MAVAVADAGTANEGAGADAEMQMQVSIPQQHRRTGKFYAGSCGLVGDHVDRKGEGRHKPHVNGRARTPRVFFFNRSWVITEFLGALVR